MTAQAPQTRHVDDSTQRRSYHWRDFINARMLTLVFLGFSSGLPLYLLVNLVQAWFSKRGIDIKQIGLFTLVMLPYTWKFLWAPMMDRYLPLGLGRRRGWLLLTQVLLLGAIAAIGRLDPVQELGPVALIAVFIAFVSATQDIAIDAYSREILSDDEQGLGAAVKVNAYKVATLVPGSLSLILADHLAWSQVFAITASFMLPGIACTVWMREPEIYAPPPKDLTDAVVRPFREFVKRDGWQQAGWILAFVFLYRIGDTMAATLATKFLLDLGFRLTEIGVIAKMTLFWGSIAGGIVGGIWMMRLGINRALWVFGVIQATTSLGYAALAYVGPVKSVLAVSFAYEAFGVGLGTAAIVAFMARASDKRYTATQYALFTSLAAVPRSLLTASIGYIVTAMGWFNFFLFCFVLAIPGMVLLFKVAPWNEAEPAEQTDQ